MCMMSRILYFQNVFNELLQAYRLRKNWMIKKDFDESVQLGIFQTLHTFIALFLSRFLLS